MGKVARWLTVGAVVVVAVWVVAAVVMPLLRLFLGLAFGVLKVGLVIALGYAVYALVRDRTHLPNG